MNDIYQNENDDLNVADSQDIKKNKKLTDAVDYMEIFVLAICFVIFVFSFFVRICTVSGDSMVDTLHHKEMLFVSDLFYTPRQGDIIVFHQNGGRLNEPVVKRVIATEGETVIVDHKNYKVTVIDKNGNENVLEEPYVVKDPFDPQFFAEAVSTYNIGEGEVFVMGDNRDHSNDSRKNEIGLVDERRILGKVIFRITPLSELGPVE